MVANSTENVDDRELKKIYSESNPEELVGVILNKHYQKEWDHIWSMLAYVDRVRKFEAWERGNWQYWGTWKSVDNTCWLHQFKEPFHPLLKREVVVNIPDLHFSIENCHLPTRIIA